VKDKNKKEKTVIKRHVSPSIGAVKVLELFMYDLSAF
jgi:hypothetical protein